MNDFENAIEIKNLKKKYDGFTLENVSFSVPKGSIMGFIGQKRSRKDHNNKSTFKHNKTRFRKYKYSRNGK